MKKTILKLFLLPVSLFLLNSLLVNPAVAQWNYSGNGIPLGVVYSMTSNGDYIFAGTIFGVYKSNNFGNSWVSANGGQIIVYTQSVTSNNKDIYATSISNGVLKSLDNGENWTTLGIPGVITNKISVINNNLYVGANNGVEKTSNQGSNWNNVLPLNSNGYEIKSLSNYLFASTENGVYRSNDAGESWEQVFFNGQTINCLNVYNNKLLAGHGSDGVWASEDFGSNWYKIGLQSISIYSLASRGAVIFAGTDEGFYLTADYGMSWTLSNEGLPTSPGIKSIFVSEPYIFSGTTFHSIYKRPLVEFGLTISPVLESPANGSVQVSITPQLIWNSSENSTSYRCVVSDNPNFSNLIIDQVISDTSYQVPNEILSSLTQYFWKVKSINEYGQSEWSEVFNFTTLLMAPTASPNLISPYNGESNISLTPNLTWSFVNSAELYTCWVSTDINFNSKIYDTTVADLFTQIPAGLLNTFTQYYWKVYGSNAAGNGPWSLRYTFTTLNSTNITNNLPGIPKNFDLHNNYPNPFNPVTKIQFDVPKNSVVKINVYDITGKEITTLVNDFRNAGRYEVQFNANNLSSGIYFYKMQAGDFMAVRKMLLIK